jgi:phosphatidylglycerophosphate synthase
MARRQARRGDIRSEGGRVLDTILTIVVVVCFIASISVLPIWAPDLFVVLVVAGAIAIYDLLIRPYRTKRADPEQLAYSRAKVILALSRYFAIFPSSTVACKFST